MRAYYAKFFEILVLVLAMATIYLTSKTDTASQSHATLLFPPKDIKYFSLGYQEVIADTLWIRSLQDIDTCGQATKLDTTAKRTEVEKNVIDEQDTMSIDHLKTFCNDGWSSRMMDAVTELAPRFKMPYLVGATILSIVVHDNVGASRIFSKGVERFPEDWTMAFRAAYHFMAGEKDFKKAAEYLILAGKHGAPPWVFALASRLETTLGQALVAQPILQEAIAADPDSIFAPELKKRLEQVNRTIEKGQ